MTSQGASTRGNKKKKGDSLKGAKTNVEGVKKKRGSGAIFEHRRSLRRGENKGGNDG